MGSHVTKAKVLSSLFWKLSERITGQGIQFVLTIIVARLLLPEEYGLFVLVTIFTSFASVIVQNGFNIALIQKKNIDKADFSSVFYLNLLIATVLYIIFYYISPIIASFFNESQLTSLFRVLFLTLFFGAINSVQNAVIARGMHFKKQFYSNLGAVIGSGFVGIGMAYFNFGVWTLVGQQLSYQLLMTVLLLFTVNWRPSLCFSISRIKDLFSFGWKLLVSSLIDTVDTNIRSLIIGKLFNPAMLGFYSRGEQLPSLLVNNINGSIQAVMLPALASHQDNKFAVKQMMRRSIITSNFVIFPMMVGLVVIAEPLIAILLTEKWLPAVPFLQIFCFVYAFWPIHTVNLQAINALGRSDIFLKLEIIKKLVGLIILGVSIPFGPYGMVLGILAGGFLATFINAHPNSKLLNYGIKEQWKDIYPSVLLSMIMGAVVYTIHWLHMSPSLTLIAQIFTGVILYIGLARLFKMESFIYILTTVKSFSKRNKKGTLIINKDVL